MDRTLRKYLFDILFSIEEIESFMANRPQPKMRVSFWGGFSTETRYLM